MDALANGPLIGGQFGRYRRQTGVPTAYRHCPSVCFQSNKAVPPTPPCLVAEAKQGIRPNRAANLLERNRSPPPDFRPGYETESREGLRGQFYGGHKLTDHKRVAVLLGLLREAGALLSKFLSCNFGPPSDFVHCGGVPPVSKCPLLLRTVEVAFMEEIT